MIILGMRKRGTGPRSLEICPLPEEPRMDGFQMGVVTIKASDNHINKVNIINDK